MSVQDKFSYLKMEMKTPSSTKLLRELLETLKWLVVTTALLLNNKVLQQDPGGI
jgi:hypothetical protein